MMSEKLERDAFGGNGSIGTKVRGVPTEIGSAGLRKVAEGRRVGYKHLDSSTVSFFFTKYPEKAKNSYLRKLFECYGQVVEVFVPQKVDKWRRKFGFVKFKEVEDLEDLEARLEEVWLWKVRLKVNKARFSREERKGDEEGRGRVAVERGVGAVVMESKKPSFSWNRSQFPDLQKEIPCLEVRPSEEMLQYLEGCFVAELHQNLEATALQQLMVMEGIHGVEVTSMGDKWMLLSFEGNRDIEPIQNSHKRWWNSIFKRVRSRSP